jgi:segregation and condensation protein B
MSHKRILEAALFISNSPMSLDQLARVSGINSLGHVKELMEGLQNDYEGRGLEVASTPDGWSMQVRQDLLPRVAHLTPYSDLGEGPKRTLALVTVKEPVKQSEIIRLQGNKAYSYIKDLARRGLIITEREGHTKVLRLTQEFERYFGEEKSKIREQLQRHLEAAGKEPDEPEEAREFLDGKPAKEKAGASVIKKAAREVPGGKADEFGEDDDEPDDDEPEAEESVPKRKGREVKASHGHAFREIE